MGMFEDQEGGHVPREISRIMNTAISIRSLSVSACVMSPVPRGAPGGKGLEISVKVTFGHRHQSKVAIFKRQLQKKKYVRLIEVED